MNPKILEHNFESYGQFYSDEIKIAQNFLFLYE